MIDIKQFDGKIVTPKDDALLYDFLISQTGIFEGCTVTHLGANQLRISDGRGIMKGRNFVVSQETIFATLSDNGMKKGRLIIRIDLANTEKPISFITQMSSVLPALVQEDINHDGSVYELPIATYDATEVLISNLAMVAPVVTSLPRTPAEIGASPANHNHDGRYATAAQGTKADAAMPRSGGYFNGGVHLNSHYQDIWTPQVRNIQFSQSAPTGGIEGAVWHQYK